MKYLLVLLLLFAGTAHGYVGSAYYETSTTKIWLLTKACTNADMNAFFAQHTQVPALEAIVVYQGRQLYACWVGLESKDSGAIVFLKDQEGDVGGIPLVKFKPTKDT